MKRAKMLAEQDGFEWELTWKLCKPGADLNPTPYLTEERRQQYIVRARAQLREEGA